MTLYFLLSNGTEIGAAIFRAPDRREYFGLRRILDRCVRYYPNERYQDCWTLQRDLIRCRRMW